jgi:hypothetical protein
MSVFCGVLVQIDVIAHPALISAIKGNFRKIEMLKKIKKKGGNVKKNCISENNDLHLYASDVLTNHSKIV